MPSDLARAFGSRTSLGPLLQHLIGAMKRLPRGQELEWSVSQSVPLDVPVDHRDLEDIFGNLLDNARKWARSRVLIQVSTNDSVVEVAIADDGPGIPKDSAAEVLAGGVRLDRSVPGTGIGLAIARDLIELNHASLGLDRSPMGGLRAVVRFPAELPIA